MSKTFPSSTTARAARPHALAATVASVCLLWGSPSLAFTSGSNGADGALNPAVNTEIQLPSSGILNYTTINIPAGVLVTFKKNAFNTPVYLLASGNVTIAGTINVSGGNSTDTGTSGDGNQADDGIPGASGPGGFAGGVGGRDDSQARAAIISGGAGLGPGGGAGSNTRGNGCYGGVYYHYHGKGGAYSAKGGNLYGNGYSCNDPIDFGVAQPYGSPSLQPLIGGSGGGGGQGGVSFPGTGGGGGGGAILIASSNTINITGFIVSKGGSAGRIAGTGAGAQGGGGAGGAIRLIATTISGSGILNAEGGCIFSGNTSSLVGCPLTQHGGSPGRIRVEGEAITFSGSSSPQFSTDTPSSVFVNNLPVLRISSVAGTTVPANPTGSADVVLPANLTNPVTVNFETTNIPPGNTVKLRVVPAYNDFIEVLSPAITGSSSSGNTSVSVNLPQGPSTLQAITSYTVTVAMGESLSRFAQNEIVETVEIITGLGTAESTARLITVSGKSFDVPTSILQMVGFNG